MSGQRQLSRPGEPRPVAPGSAAPRSGRRAGDSGTREAILRAARSRFADHGYDGATIRGIAADAGVDPALVHHFYGTKERLFAAAMRLPVVPSEILTAALAGDTGDQQASPGDRLIRTALSLWQSAELRGVFLGLLRSALTSERAAAMLREFVTEAILAPVATMASSRDPAETAYRAALVASQVVGLALTRYVLQVGPVASADADDIAAAIGPTIDRYLTGDLRPPAGVAQRER